MNVTYKRLTGLGLATLLGASVAACGDAPSEAPAQSAKADATTHGEGEGEAAHGEGEGEGEGEAAHAEGEGEGEAAHAEGEGEGEAAHAEGEGEGESAHAEGEGEGDAAHAEGEGDAAHAEGEGEEAHGGEGEGEGEGGHATMATLPVEKRVAFMSGHVEAGLALYRAGAPDQAAKHLLHPVSETHQAERAGIDALGFEPAVFEAVSAALAAGKPAAELEPQLAAAEANMALMQRKAGGDPDDVIAYLMNTVVEEYTVGVRDGKVTDPGEFQDAYGFSVVALKMSKRMDEPAAKEVVTHLEALVALWPSGGPLADATPTPVAKVSAQTSKVLLALSSL
jgi:hypothetical protein